MSTSISVGVGSFRPFYPFALGRFALGRFALLIRPGSIRPSRWVFALPGESFRPHLLNTDMRLYYTVYVCLSINCH